MRPLIAERRPSAPPPPAARATWREAVSDARRDARRDPAPSLWAYRMQRVMLTPHLRALLRIGLPTFAVLFACGIYAADEGRRAAVVQQYVDLREKFQQRPEFMVSQVSVEGSSPELTEAVRGRLDLKLPQSSFDLDLDAARDRLETMDAVKSADLRVRSGGILQVIITERQPVAVWRAGEALTLLDETGHRVAGLLERMDRADLPLVAGAGADRAMGEALEILAAASPLTPRIRGLVRMGERRWDVVLDRKQRILLPVENPARAIERLLALDNAQNILARDLAVVDLRIGQRPTLRLTPYAVNEIRRAQGLEPLESKL